MESPIIKCKNATKCSKTISMSTISSQFENNPARIPPVSELYPFAQKCGSLKRLCGRSILTAGTWRTRFCLLVKNKLYYFENEESQGTEKSCGFINLDDLRTCAVPEVNTRVTRKVVNVFVIGSNESKSFFETNRDYYFSADTTEQLNEWTTAVNEYMIHHRVTSEGVPVPVQVPVSASISIKSCSSNSNDDSTTTKSTTKSAPVTATAQEHEQHRAQMNHHKNCGSGSSGAKANLKSPKGDRPSSIFEQEPKMKSSAGNGNSPNNPEAVLLAQLDLSMAKGRVKGPPGRRLPRKLLTNPNPKPTMSLSSASHDDLLKSAIATTVTAHETESAPAHAPQPGSALSRSQRAKSLCLLSTSEPDPVPVSMATTTPPSSVRRELKSCRDNAKALRRLSTAISSGNGQSSSGTSNPTFYDCSKEDYWNSGQSCKSIELVDLDLDSYGNCPESQPRDRDRGHGQKVKDGPERTIMTYSSSSSSSSSCCSNEVEGEDEDALFNGSKGGDRAIFGQQEKLVAISSSKTPSGRVRVGQQTKATTQAQAQAQSPSVKFRRKLVQGSGQGSGGGSVAKSGAGAGGGIEKDFGYKGDSPAAYHRNSASMTPPSCVLQKLRQAFLSASAHLPSNITNFYADGEDSQDEILSLLPEPEDVAGAFSSSPTPTPSITSNSPERHRNCQRSRNSSGSSNISSSPSTLTAVSAVNSKKVEGLKIQAQGQGHGQPYQLSYSSLHRPTGHKYAQQGSYPIQLHAGHGQGQGHGHGHGHGQGHEKVKLWNNRGYNSASASPLLNGQNGAHRRYVALTNNLAPGASSGLGSCNSGLGSGSSPLGQAMETIKHEIDSATLESRQLDIEMLSLRQDVGSVQENITKVNSRLESTRDRVGKLGLQVTGIERQINSIVKETNTIRDHAVKLLASAECSKQNYKCLEEEAGSLIGFLKEIVLHYTTSCACCNTNTTTTTEMSESSCSRNGHGTNSGPGQKYDECWDKNCPTEFLPGDMLCHAKQMIILNGAAAASAEHNDIGLDEMKKLNGDGTHVSCAMSMSD